MDKNKLEINTDLDDPKCIDSSEKQHNDTAI